MTEEQYRKITNRIRERQRQALAELKARRPERPDGHHDEIDIRIVENYDLDDSNESEKK